MLPLLLLLLGFSPSSPIRAVRDLAFGARQSMRGRGRRESINDEEEEEEEEGEDEEDEEEEEDEEAEEAEAMSVIAVGAGGSGGFGSAPPRKRSISTGHGGGLGVGISTTFIGRPFKPIPTIPILPLERYPLGPWLHCMGTFALFQNMWCSVFPSGDV